MWFGVILITFLLFHGTRDPRDVASERLGKNPSPEAVADWIHKRGYGLPVFWNTDSYKKDYKFLHKKYPEHYKNLAWDDTQFFETVKKFMIFDLGVSDNDERPILPMMGKENLAVPNNTNSSISTYNFSEYWHCLIRLTVPRD